MNSMGLVSEMTTLGAVASSMAKPSTEKVQAAKQTIKLMMLINRNMYLSILEINREK